MSGIAIVMEIEEVLFDTLDVRARALRDALHVEGVDVTFSDVATAHAGVTARVALSELPGAASLDDVSRDLVLRRTADAVRDTIGASMPAFSRAAHDVVQDLAIEFPMGVVTRATHDDAMRMLDHAELTACFRVVLSLDDRSDTEQVRVWSSASARLFGLRTVAIGPARSLRAARTAGLPGIPVRTSDALDDDTLVPISQLDASFVASVVAIPPQS